ncbi:hypothetical protein V8C44DRAFT_328252 [Trichoderma aethiopicum]
MSGTSRLRELRVSPASEQYEMLLGTHAKERYHSVPPILPRQRTGVRARCAPPELTRGTRTKLQRPTGCCCRVESFLVIYQDQRRGRIGTVSLKDAEPDADDGLAPLDQSERRGLDSRAPGRRRGYGEQEQRQEQETGYRNRHRLAHRHRRQTDTRTRTYLIQNGDLLLPRQTAFARFMARHLHELAVHGRLSEQQLRSGQRQQLGGAIATLGS